MSLTLSYFTRTWPASNTSCRNMTATGASSDALNCCSRFGLTLAVKPACIPPPDLNWNDAKEIRSEIVLKPTAGGSTKHEAQQSTRFATTKKRPSARTDILSGRTAGDAKSCLRWLRHFALFLPWLAMPSLFRRCLRGCFCVCLWGASLAFFLFW